MKTMKLRDLFESKKQTLSFEVFPPKTNQGILNLLVHLKKLEKFSPDFISVTYGAGGGTQERSLELLDKVVEQFKGAVVAHFTCIGQDKKTIKEFITRIENMGIGNILALRGDIPKNDTSFDFSKNEFKYANDLVSFIRKETNLSIGVAGYPEGHITAHTKEIDWDNLKRKIDSGADFVVTQLFFDNNDYFKFREAMVKRGIYVPLVPGILPVPSRDSLDKIIDLSGATPSNELLNICRKYINSEEDFKKASIEYTKKQVANLLDSDVPGIHYYILNKSEMITEILSGS